MEWAFRTTFTASESELSAPNADLVFDGIDTFATIQLVSLSSGQNDTGYNIITTPRTDVRYSSECVFVNLMFGN